MFSSNSRPKFYDDLTAIKLLKAMSKSVSIISGHPLDVAEKFSRQWGALDEIFQMKFDPGVTCDVTGQVKHKMFGISI